MFHATNLTPATPRVTTTIPVDDSRFVGHVINRTSPESECQPYAWARAMVDAHASEYGYILRLARLAWHTRHLPNGSPYAFGIGEGTQLVVSGNGGGCVQAESTCEL
jgi:hypothetical protein